MMKRKKRINECIRSIGAHAQWLMNNKYFAYEKWCSIDHCTVPFGSIHIYRTPWPSEFINYLLFMHAWLKSQSRLRCNGLVRFHANCEQPNSAPRSGSRIEFHILNTENVLTGLRTQLTDSLILSKSYKYKSESIERLSRIIHFTRSGRNRQRRHCMGTHLEYLRPIFLQFSGQALKFFEVGADEKSIIRFRAIIYLERALAFSVSFETIFCRSNDRYHKHRLFFAGIFDRLKKRRISKQSI